MANQQRVSRAQESREAEVIHESYADSWDPATLLNTDDIPPREGYAQRWVRVSLKGVDDQANVMRKYNEHWRPRPADTIPKGQFAPTVMFQDANVVGVSGSILFERPLELHNRHKQFKRQQAMNLVDAEKHNLYKVHEREQHKKYVTRPSYESSVNTTTGRVPDIDD